jgi:hypothetical protein
MKVIYWEHNIIDDEIHMDVEHNGKTYSGTLEGKESTTHL